MTDANNTIIGALIKSYNDEIETVANYIANSVNLDGVRAKQIAGSLDADIAEELGHARLLAARIKTIGGTVPGSQALKMSQSFLQPPEDSTDVITVIKGVIQAEETAIAGYKRLIEMCDREDPVTQDLAVTILGDEQNHLREFRGYLKEYEKGR